MYYSPSMRPVSMAAMASAGDSYIYYALRARRTARPPACPMPRRRRCLGLGPSPREPRVWARPLCSVAEHVDHISLLEQGALHALVTRTDCLGGARVSWSGRHPNYTVQALYIQLSGMKTQNVCLRIHTTHKCRPLPWAWQIPRAGLFSRAYVPRVPESPYAPRSALAGGNVIDSVLLVGSKNPHMPRYFWVLELVRTSPVKIPDKED